MLLAAGVDPTKATQPDTGGRGGLTPLALARKSKDMGAIQLLEDATYVIVEADGESRAARDLPGTDRAREAAQLPKDEI